jgi:hypothetical protein
MCIVRYTSLSGHQMAVRLVCRSAAGRSQSGDPVGVAGWQAGAYLAAAGRQPVRSAACPLPPPRPGRLHPQSSTLRQTETFRRPFGPTQPAPRLRTTSLHLARSLRCRVLDDGYEIASLPPFSVLLHPCPVLPRLHHRRRGRCELRLVSAMISVLHQDPGLYDHLVPQTEAQMRRGFSKSALTSASEEHHDVEPLMHLPLCPDKVILAGLLGSFAAYPFSALAGRHDGEFIFLTQCAVNNPIPQIPRSILLCLI